MIIVLMGVSGSGKSTVGRILAEDLRCAFVDADDLHPASNVEKLRAGVPLTDADRRPWLDALAQLTADLCRRGIDIVLACSALKHAYQEHLSQRGCTEYVHLVGSPELIQQRLEQRKGHFMNPGLLASQFATLEPPAGALEVDITPPPEEIAAEIRRQLGR